MKILNNWLFKSLLIVFICVAILLNIAAAQTPLGKDIVISGTLSDKLIKALKPGADIKIYKEIITGPDANLNRSYPLILKDSSFKFTIKPIADFMYLQILFGSKTIRTKMFLIRPGDSLNLDMRDVDDFSFQSNNDLFASQLELNKAIENTDHSYTLDTATLRRQEHAFFTALNQTLEKYNGILPSQTSELLKVNYSSVFRRSLLRKLSTTALGLNPDTTINQAPLITYIDSTYRNFVPVKSNFIIKNSIFYVSYIYELEKIWNGIKADKKDFINNKFKAIHNVIQHKYSGVLKEKLLSVLFLLSSHSPDAIQFLDQSLPHISDSLYKQIFLALQASKTAGSDAFPFELESIDGKIYSLKDFRGKVLICKFWFTGCAGCATLEQLIKPVKAKFKDNANIAFVSINVDMSKQKWINGIKKGIYSSFPDIMLSTFGSGTKHPMLEFYHFYGYPQLLLIDKEGKIISSSPAKPSDEDSLSKLEDLIKRNL